jgi:lysophospholipase L1-like esterase
MDKNSINIKRIGYFTIILILLIFVFGEQTKEFVDFYNTSIKFYFTKNISQLKICYPNFYWVVFLLTRFIKYIIPFTLLLKLFHNRKKLTSQLMKNLFYKLIILFFSLFISIIVIEGVLRFSGFKPGKTSYSQWVKSVDTLEYLKGFTTDSLGIFKVDTQYLNLFNCQNTNSSSINYNRYKNGYVNEIFSLNRDYNQIKSKELDNSFRKKINNLSIGKSNDLDSAILNYIDCPINNEGFHSIEFKQYKTKKTKVLLLGDSFTWGHSTTNKTNNFANELLAKDYIIYNTGISGADATQYKAIAERYIPILKPDIVILNFFMGNDIIYHERKLKPYQPIFYSTNAGNLMSNQNGIEYPTAQEAYDNIMKASYMPTNTLARRFASKMVISTFAWTACWKLGLANYPSLENSVVKLKKPSCNQEIKDIVSICKENGSKFELVIIPDFLYNKTKVVDFPYLFENIDYSYSPILESSYKKSDGHFNDKGHQEYAEFLDKLIKE